MRIDEYVVDTLMPDLVGHDRQPSAFIVYLYLTYRSARRTRVAISLQEIAIDTGLSKSAVQKSLRTLKRRRLIDARRQSETSVPEYIVRQPWRK